MGAEILRLRRETGLSLRETARAAGIAPSHLLRVERGDADLSMASLVAVTTVLGHDASLRFYPSDGPRVRDRIQVQMVEALLRACHPRWTARLEVAVHHPVRGVIDVTLHDPVEGVLVAGEAHSLLEAVDAQVRWAAGKADALPSATGWPWTDHPGDEPRIGRLLVLRNTEATRNLVRTVPHTFRAAYPERTRAATASLTGTERWPGAAVVWVDVRGGATRLLDGPPRGVET